MNLVHLLKEDLSYLHLQQQWEHLFKSSAVIRFSSANLRWLSWSHWNYLIKFTGFYHQILNFNFGTTIAMISIQQKDFEWALLLSVIEAFLHLSIDMIKYSEKSSTVKEIVRSSELRDKTDVKILITHTVTLVKSFTAAAEVALNWIRVSDDSVTAVTVLIVFCTLSEADEGIFIFTASCTISRESISCKHQFDVSEALIWRKSTQNFRLYHSSQIRQKAITVSIR